MTRLAPVQLPVGQLLRVYSGANEGQAKRVPPIRQRSSCLDLYILSA